MNRFSLFFGKNKPTKIKIILRFYDDRP